MTFLKNFDWSAKSIAKVIGLFLLGVVVVTVVIALISFSFRTVFQPGGYNSYDKYGVDGMYDMAYEESVSSPMMARKLSMPPMPEPGYTTGDDAESFEVKSYNATIKTRKMEETCGIVGDLKVYDYVIFENSDQNDDRCYFRFKVKKEKTDEILKIIEDLKPEILNENISTIKGTIEFYDKQLDIQERKLASIEEEMEKAQKAYDEVRDLATRARDVESLTTIIKNKLDLVKELSSERLRAKEQIDRYNQNKADQMDRLNYSFFKVNIQKDLILDWKEIKDSWKRELRYFVENFNEVIQGISVHLVTYMIRFVQVAIYFFISVFLLKFAWIATKRIWKGRKK